MPIRIPPDAKITNNDPSVFETVGKFMSGGEDPGPVDIGLAALPLLDAPFLKSLGKPLSELLDTVLTPLSKGTGLPKRLRLTNWDARTGNIQFHGADKIGQPFEATPSQLDELINAGHLGVEQPPNQPGLKRKLEAQFDAAVGDPRNPTIGLPRQTRSPMRAILDDETPAYRANQFTRNSKK